MFYEIRAVNEIGAGGSAETSGRRQVGSTIEYIWESSGDGTDYAPVGCGTRICQDMDAPSDGTPYYYRVLISVDGVEDVVVDAGQGYRAVLGLAFDQQPPAQVTAGESFAANVKLVSQDGNLENPEGIEIDLTAYHDTAAPDGIALATAVTDADGVAAFDGLVLETAASDYWLEATSEHEDLQNTVVESSAFAVVAAAPSADNSTIYADGGEVLADGTDEAHIFIELYDSYGNPVSGEATAFHAEPESGNTYLDCSETSQAGQYQCAMTSTEAGDKQLYLDQPVAVTGGTVTFAATCDPAGTPFGGGEGTETSPYRICAPDQLNEIGTDTTYLEGWFRLENDLDMSGIDYNVVGTETDPFVGHFDGNEYAISNLDIGTSGDENVGLFGFVAGDALVENTELQNVAVYGKKHVGGIAGQIGDAYNSTGEVNNCRVSGTVEAENADGLAHVGGLVGSLQFGSIVDSSAHGAVTSHDGYFVGGVAGMNASGDVTDSYSTADVEAVGTYAGEVGGLVGRNQLTVAGSFATGSVSGGPMVGGLVGRNVSYGTVWDSYATGAVTGDSSIGGLAGEHDSENGEIVDSYASGVIDDTATDAGGLVGVRPDGDELVTNSYWDEDTTGMSTSDGGSALVTDQFGDESNFDNWDFTDIWVMGTAPDGESRPILQWQ